MRRPIEGEPLNLPFIMISQMREAACRARACLPYGMVFTLLFQDAHVDLTGEDCRLLLHTDRYTVKSLTRMGFIKVDGNWIRKTSGVPVAHSEDSDDDAQAAQGHGEETEAQTDEAGPSEPAPTTPHSPVRTPTAARHDTDDRLHRVLEEISCLRTDTDRRISSLQSEMQQGFHDIMAILR